MEWKSGMKLCDCDCVIVKRIGSGMGHATGFGLGYPYSVVGRTEA